MGKKHFKVYILFFVSFAFISMILPKVFPRSNKMFNNLWVKAVVKVSSKPVLAQPLSTNSKINIVFILDDGWETQYTIGYKLLKKYNMSGNISAIPSLVGHENYMTINQMADLYINGWDILNHTFNHYDITSLSSKESLKEFNKGRSWLKSHGFTRAKDVVIFPGGFYDNEIIDALMNSKYTSARGLEKVWNFQPGLKETNVSIRNLDSSIEPLWAMDWIDESIDNNKDIFFILHKLEKVTTSTGMQYEPKKLEEILNYIAAKKDKVNVVTYSQWLNK